MELTTQNLYDALLYQEIDPKILKYDPSTPNRLVVFRGAKVGNDCILI